MRKFFISILTIAIVFSTTIELLTFSVNATNNNELLKDSFYASKAEQDRLFQATQEETGDILKCLIWEDRTLLKESITPIYTANYMEFAETGKLTVTPGTVTTSNGERQRYLAKTIASDGSFAGDIEFYIENGVAKLLGYQPINEDWTTFNYADHAKRIQTLLGRTSFVPVSNVKYVFVENLGEVFYINDRNREFLVCIATWSEIFSYGEGEIVVLDNDLKKRSAKMLEEYKDRLAYVEEWKAVHPDEPLPPGTTTTIITNWTIPDNVDNIIDIRNYIETNMNMSISNDTVDNPSFEDKDLNGDLSGDTNSDLPADADTSSERDPATENLTAETVENKDKDFSSLKIGIVCGITLLTGIVVFSIVRIHKRKKQI